MAFRDDEAPRLAPACYAQQVQAVPRIAMLVERLYVRFFGRLPKRGLAVSASFGRWGLPRGDREKRTCPRSATRLPRHRKRLAMDALGDEAGVH